MSGVADIRSPDVRNGEEGDIEQLTAIYNHYVATTHVTFDLEPFTAQQRRDNWFHHYGQEGPHRLLVAVEGGNVLGYATSSPFRAKPAYVTTVETSVYCEPGAVGRGIGGVLYDHLFAAIADEDLHRAIAGIALPNDGSIRLHRRFGFTDIGVEHEVGRKFDRYWDVLMLEKALP
jgi:phosphinothricin acetyltransferase